MNNYKRRSSFKFPLFLVTIALAEAANRGYVIPPANQVNLRGRCAFGRPCDNHKLSYGCEIFSNDAETDAPKGVCWSECTGYLPRSNGEGAFMYEGWCYNLNSKHSMAAELSGKKNRHRRARMSEEEMIAMEEAKVEAQEEDIALEEYNGMISEVRKNIEKVSFSRRKSFFRAWQPVF